MLRSGSGLGARALREYSDFCAFNGTVELLRARNAALGQLARTAATAAEVAQMVGGKVVASDQLAAAGGFLQQQPNQMIELADGRLVNAGQVAAFYTHGYPQSYIDMLIQNETQGT